MDGQLLIPPTVRCCLVMNRPEFSSAESFIVFRLTYGDMYYLGKFSVRLFNEVLESMFSLNFFLVWFV